MGQPPTRARQARDYHGCPVPVLCIVVPTRRLERLVCGLGKYTSSYWQCEEILLRILLA
jgi:hypothetical protein